MYVSRRHKVLTAVVTLLTAFAIGADAPDAPEVTEPPAQEEFLVIPLRVHVLQAEDLPDVHCGLTDDDVRRILGKVNGIWHNAGIHFALESLRREPAEDTGKFRLARDLSKRNRTSVDLFPAIRPKDSRKFDGLHVYYIHQFEVNGIYMGSDYSFVQETSGLRPVDGGIDEPIPRVTAHELGHALGLPHRQNLTNLLASGTTGTLLNRPEVEKARDHAKTTPGVRTYAELRDAAAAAESAGDRETARRLWNWLAEIPGDGAEKAREKLRGLSDLEKSAP